jgi:predicted extracellular nuclease
MAKVASVVRARTVSVLAAVMVLAVLAPVPAQADEHDSGAAVVISQVYGGGGNSGALYTHDFIELVNRTDAPVGLAGWSVQYASSTGSSWQVTALAGEIGPGEYLLVQQAAGAGGTQPLPTPDVVGTIAMAAGSGKVALVPSVGALAGTCPLGDVVDFVGYGSANCFEGAGTAPTLTNTTSASRLSGGCQDTDQNGVDFTSGAVVPRNSASPVVDCGVDPGDPGGEPVGLTCPTSPVPGVDVSTTQTYDAERLVSASVADGTVVDLALTVTPTPATGSIALDDVVPAGAVGGSATATLVVSADVAPGVYATTITATADDDRTGSCAVVVEVMAIVPIGAVQGEIADGQTSFTSPLLNQRVAVRGVVTQRTRESSGARGFFLQERADATDGNPLSSDGIFVFNGNFTTVRTEAEGPARADVGNNWTVTIGDEIVLRGTVGQFFGMTQFAGSSAFVWDITDTGLDVDDTVAVVEIDPPDDAGDSLRYFRRHLGMQMEVPAGSLVVNGRDVFSGTDAEVWAIRGDHPVAQRSDPYARRVFRDAHPLDNNPGTAFDDGNGYRFVLGSFGLKGATDDPGAVLAPARTFDTIVDATRGGVYLSFGKYTVNVVDQLTLDTSGPDPSLNAPPLPGDRANEAHVAAYNVENLYDFRDSPNSGCDFAGNAGCFANGASVTPPFDYVPASDAEYQARLARMAEQIRLDLHNPDVVLIQETEAQDVCRVAPDWTPAAGPVLGADRLECDLTNPGEANTASDGKPDSATELALVIAEQGGPTYEAVFDPDGSDLRGITTAFLYRTDRVQLRDVDADHPILGASPTLVYDGAPLPQNANVQNPKALNSVLPPAVAATCTSSGPRACDGSNVFSRAPLVGSFRIWRTGVDTSTFTDVYLVNNHQSAGPDGRILQRTEQATYNARIAEALLAADADARVLVGGDFNVFPRPDDPYAPGAPIPGVGVGPSDQLAALYDSPLENLYETLVDRYPAAAFTFGFAGQAQTLDQMWVSPTLFDELIDVRVAKVNVDWPADATGEAPAYGRFGVSDHDPEAARFDASVDIGRIRDLIDHYRSSGQMHPAAAAAVLAQLDVIERHLDAGRVHAARGSIVGLVITINGLGWSPLLDRDAANALANEVSLLAP